MKYICPIVIALFIISCKHYSKAPRELLSFVNEGNDGFNAFSITLRDDSTYEEENFGSSNSGKYSISKNCISLGDQKIIFDQTPIGCIYNANYISANSSTSMRVIFDSLFCRHIRPENIIGNWKLEYPSLIPDTLELHEDRIAKFKGITYEKWGLDYSDITLVKNQTSSGWIVLNWEQDTIWLTPKHINPIDMTLSIKGVRIK